MPENDAYGVWPRSGEIDIAEARGNGPEYSMGGRDIFVSTMHWGKSEVPGDHAVVPPILTVHRAYIKAECILESNER